MTKTRLLKLIVIFGLMAIGWFTFVNQWSQLPKPLAFPATISSFPILIFSDPPHNAIQAQDLTGRLGWRIATLSFSAQLGSDWNNLGHYSIFTTNTTTPITVASVSGSAAKPEVVFSRSIIPGERITITHKPTNTSVCLGFLPGDVDQNSFAISSDISRLNAWVGTTEGAAQPLWKTDINRDGVFNAADVAWAVELMSVPNRVYRIPACPGPTVKTPPDLIPPSTITDLKLTGIYPNGQAGLNWRAPYEDSDDPISGAVTTYDIRYQIKSPITDSSWSRAVQVADEPAPRSPGAVEIYILPNLTPGQTYYVAIKSQDAAGNLSALSNNLLVTIPILEPVIPEPITPIQPMPPPSLSTFNMNIDSVTQNGDTITVTTTGAQYVLTRTSLELWRRIDPKTNTVHPRKVATLSFSSNLGPLSIETANNSKAIIQSSLAKFEFMSDSLFFITTKSPLTYTHTNLIANAPWNKGAGRDKMWTDGYGGSLHARISGGTLATSNTDSTTIALATNDAMAHMVYPPKPYDFENLYGENSRPHVVFVRSYAELAALTSAELDNYVSNGFGVVMIWATLYPDPDKDSIPDDRQMFVSTPGSMIHETPRLLESDYIGYSYSDPQKIHDFVALAHQNGFKVITYMTAPRTVFQLNWWKYPRYDLTGAAHPKYGEHQTIEDTLEWMKSFQSEFDLDGWYLDNANAGVSNLKADYDFIRQVRTDIGDDGILYHHSTRDVWGQDSRFDSENKEGLIAIFVNAYVNYIKKGEQFDISMVNSPNDEVLRYYSVGYGFSQAYTAYKRRDGDGKGALSEGEMLRMLGENFHGSARKNNVLQYSSWYDYFQPFYDVKKAEYLSGSFDADIDWPINPDNGWFRRARNVRVTYDSPTQATIMWETNLPSNSEIMWTSTGNYWRPPVPGGQLTNSTLVTNHSLTVPTLTAGLGYGFRIRSRNGLAVPNEIVWGFTFGLDTDRDGLPDDWETQYFSNLNQTASGDPDNDGFSNIDEFANGTNPLVSNIPITPDTTLPSTITDLKLTGTYPNGQAGLNWRAPYEDGDDPTSGAVTSYDIRYDVKPITDSVWPRAIQVADEPAPRSPGTVEIYILPNLTSGQTYYVALRSQDAAGNISALSNNLLITMPKLVVEESITPIQLVFLVATTTIVTDAVARIAELKTRLVELMKILIGLLKERLTQLLTWRGLR